MNNKNWLPQYFSVLNKLRMVQRHPLASLWQKVSFTFKITSHYGMKINHEQLTQMKILD